MHRSLKIVLLFSAITGLVYFNSFYASFVGDDLAVIPNNTQHLGSYSSILSYFTNGVWNHTNISFEDHHLYRPLWLLWTFMIYQVAGETALVWHITNLLLHIANGFLVFTLIKSFYKSESDTAAIVSALFFLIHPIAGQNAIWVSGSTDLLLTLFCLGALISFIKYREHNLYHSLLITIICTTGAVLTKEGGLILLPLLVIIDLSRNTNFKVAAKTYPLLVVVAGGYFMLRFQALDFVSGEASKWDLNISALTRAIEYGSVYLRTVFLPWPLPVTIKHPPAGVSTFTDPYLGLFLFLSLFFTVIKFPKFRFGISLIFLPMAIPLLLAINELGMFASRFLYLSIVGLALTLCPLIEKYSRNIQSRTLIVLLFTTLTSLTITETYSWKTQEAFCKKLISYNSQNADNWIALAKNYDQGGKNDQAISTYRQAESEIESPIEKSKVVSALGKYYAAHNDNSSSIDEFRKLTLTPGAQHVGFTGIGNNLWVLGRLDEALTNYKRAIQYKPNHFYALYNLGQINARLGHYREAVIAYEQIINLPLEPGINISKDQIEQQLQLWKLKVRQEKTHLRPDKYHSLTIAIYS